MDGHVTIDTVVVRAGSAGGVENVCQDGVLAADRVGSPLGGSR